MYFLRVARGSIAELETQLLLAERVGCLPESPVAGLQPRIEEIERIRPAVVASFHRRQD
jgi:four helix bundle protein